MNGLLLTQVIGVLKVMASPLLTRVNGGSLLTKVNKWLFVRTIYVSNFCFSAATARTRPCTRLFARLARWQ